MSEQEHGQAITAAAEAIFAVTQHEMDHEKAVAAANRHARLAVEAAAPLLHDNRWQALKDWLAGSIAADLEVAEAFKGGDEAAVACSRAHFALVSAHRSTLAKMRELDGSR